MKSQALLKDLNSAQRTIACTLDVPLFVEAGAGSGKTFTLTKRIVWALSDGSGLDGKPFLDNLGQALIITFTEAAAREIRERARSSLRAAGMHDAALQVDSAWISTIHGMCSRILHRHALDLGLDPNFAHCSENLQDTLYNQAMDEVIGQAKKNEECRELFLTFTTGAHTLSGFTGAMDILDSLIQAAKRCRHGFDDLELPKAIRDGSGLNIAMMNLRRSLHCLSNCKLTAKGSEAMDLVMMKLAAYDARDFEDTNSEALRDLLGSIKLPNRSAKIADELSEARQDLALARLELELFCAGRFSGQFIELARKVDGRFTELKRHESVLDNDDLILAALSAVRDHPEIRHELQNRFRLVMVDEFQDTDKGQLELIMGLVGKGAAHLCTVGDAQQSIYRFRGADVEVFRAHGRRVPEDYHVRLDINYRSHKDVLSFVERICGGAGSGVRKSDTKGDTKDSDTRAHNTKDYNIVADDTKASATNMLGAGVHLGPGVLSDYMHLEDDPLRKNGYNASQHPRIAVEVVIGKGSAGHASSYQASVMAASIADRLTRLHEAGADAGDMALLLGVTTHADLYIDAIRSRGLECIVTGGSTFTTTKEVQVMCALLYTLANPRDTSVGLFRLLSSEMFELDADDFCLLGTREQKIYPKPEKRSIDRGILEMSFYRGAQPSKRLQLAHDVVQRAWHDLSILPVADVCFYVARASGWLARLEAEGAQGGARAANVLAAIRYIRDLTEDLGLGPARAALEFERWLKLAKVPPASLSGGIASMVRVMTIHASKGLEFPIVAVAECWSNPRIKAGFVYGSLSGSKDKEKNSKQFILCPKGFSKLLSKVNINEVIASLDPLRPRMAIQTYILLREQQKAEDQAEKARLLYVALTRAREACVLSLMCASGTEGLTSTLAEGVLDALCGKDAFKYKLSPGVHKLDFGGSELASFRVIDVQQQDEKASGNKHVMIDSGNAFPCYDITLDNPSQRQLCELGTPMAEVATDKADFQLFAPEIQKPSYLRSWRIREGVFSFSSMHAALETEQAPGALGSAPASDKTSAAPAQPANLRSYPSYLANKPRKRPRQAEIMSEIEAETQGAPVVADADKATSLGSAFHVLAQMMIEQGHEPDDTQLERVLRYWRLSPKSSDRIRVALGRWVSSGIRREALRHGILQAELPFFADAPEGTERFGHYIEGAFDLLCSDEGSTEALLIDYKTGDTKLTEAQIRKRHELQARLYAQVLMDRGFTRVECAFVCVEVDEGQIKGYEPTGEPFVLRYVFDAPCHLTCDSRSHTVWSRLGDGSQDRKD